MSNESLEKRIKKVRQEVKKLKEAYVILNEIRRLLHTVVPHTEKCRLAWATKSKDQVYIRAGAAYGLIDEFLKRNKEKDGKGSK